MRKETMSETYPETNATPRATHATDDTGQPAPLWEFVPLGAYDVPAAKAPAAAAGAWHSLHRILRRKEPPDEPLGREHDLHVLSQARLAHLVPPLPWDDAAAALDAALQGMTATGLSGKRVMFCVGQPFSGHAHIVSLLGARHRAVQISPPPTERILSCDEGWFDGWPSPETFWVLPQLERCFLRHASGLDLVRCLLDLAAGGQLGSGVIGCDSWSWAFLQRISPIPESDAVTLQAFDADRLQRLLLGMMQTRSKKEIHCFNAGTGKEIMGSSSQEKPRQKEFLELAAHCRGNVGIATRFWRERLRHAPDDDEVPEDEKNGARAKPGPGEEHVWIASMPSEPELPTGKTEEFFLLLHALLLHGGLQESLLGELLPFSQAHGRALLGQLRHAGMAHCVDGRWQVSEMAYASIRRLLNARDYLTDPF